MHKGIHSPTMQTHSKVNMSRGKQSSMGKQHSNRKMVHTAAPKAMKNSKRGGY